MKKEWFELSDNEIAQKLSEAALNAMYKAAKENSVNYSDFTNKASQDLFQTQVKILHRLCGTEAICLMLQKMLHQSQPTNQGE